MILATTTISQTAMTTIHNPNQPSICQNVHAIHDLGSQRSYFTQWAARALQLEPEGIHQMSVITFGSSRKTVSNCELVRVLMKTLDGEAELHLLTTPTICEPLTAQTITLCVNSYTHLSDLYLADNSHGDSALEIDLLIGADHYWGLATGRVSRGEDGPIAVETRLGGFCQVQFQQLNLQAASL